MSLEYQPSGDKHIRTSIVNVVLGASLSDTVDLDEIAATYPDEAHFILQGPGLGLTLTLDAHVSVQIYHRGRLTCLGAKSIEQAKKSLAECVRMINKAGWASEELSITSTTVENIVAVMSLGKQLDLDKLAMRLDGAVYEPQQFAGLV